MSKVKNSIPEPKFASNPNQKSRFYYSNKPIRIISQLYGVNPYVIRGGTLTFSYWLIIYGYFIVTSTCWARIFVEPTPSSKTFFNMVVHYKNILMPVFCLLSLQFSSLKTKKILKFCLEVADLSRFMSVSLLKRSFFLQIVLLVGPYICLTFIYLVLFLHMPHAFVGRGLLEKILDFHISITLWLIKLQFFLLVLFLRNILIHVKEDVNSYQLIGKSFLFDSQNRFDLNPIMNLYDHVISLSELLNECFGVPLGATSLLTAFNCIITAYFHVSLHEEQIGIVLILWLLIDFTQEWLVLTSTELFMKEASNVVEAVHKTLRMVHDTHLREQLNEFSLFLLHRRPKFSICGLVPLDYTLLFTIAGTVTTYMIVLVQFQKTEGLLPSLNNTEF